MEEKLVISEGTDMNPLPVLSERDKDAFIVVLLNALGSLTGREPVIGIKREALDEFPEYDRPVFVWNNSKEQWFVSLPKPEKKILTPNKRIIGDNNGLG